MGVYIIKGLKISLERNIADNHEFQTFLSGQPDRHTLLPLNQEKLYVAFLLATQHNMAAGRSGGLENTYAS